MQFRRRHFIAGLGAIAAFAVAGSADAAPMSMPISPQARRLALELDSMGVETKWIAGRHVDWQTGLPDGVQEYLPGRHTHCSAFVASAAKRLGIHILRPPEHGQVLLANAQFEWLATEGLSEGWRPVASPVEAQAAANRGDLVVASYRSHRDDKPGHIAIIRPSDKPMDLLVAEGPQAIMASTINSASISVRAGFAGHPTAWSNAEIRYYSHRIIGSGLQAGN